MSLLDKLLSLFSRPAPVPREVRSLATAMAGVASLPAALRDRSLAAMTWPEAFDAPLEKVTAAMARHGETGLGLLTVVTGAPGSARELLLARAIEAAPRDTRCHLVALGAPPSASPSLETALANAHGTRITSSAELEAAFSSALGIGADKLAQELEGSRALIVVPEVHRLFERRVGGFAAIARLSQLISGAPEVFWLLGCDSFAWDLLAWAQPATLRAHLHVPTPRVTVADARTLVAAVAGDAVAARGGPEDSARPIADSLADAVARCHDLARGLPEELLVRWLASLVVEQDTVFQGEVEPIAPEPLPRGHAPSEHALAGVLLHGGLTSTSLGATLDRPRNEARALLQQLEDLGWLHSRRSVGGVAEWHIHPLATSQVATALRRGNLVPPDFGDR